MVAKIGSPAEKRSDFSVREGPPVREAAKTSEPPVSEPADPGVPARTPTPQTSEVARLGFRAEEDRLRAQFLLRAPPSGSVAPSNFSLNDAAAAIDAKIDPKLGNMDPTLADRLSRMEQSPTYAGAIPPGSSVNGVWFRNFYLDGNSDPNEPDAQVYSYDRDGTLMTFEVAGSFAQAYNHIDPGLAGSNSRLGLPTSGREFDPATQQYFQNFENGKLVETQSGSPAKFTWLDGNGAVVVEDFEVPGVDLAAADQLPPKNGGFVKPVDAPLTPGSEFAIPDAEGAPAANGVRYHAGKDWFAPAGTTVRAPIDGRIVGVTQSRGNSGQVFGGAVYVQGEDGRVWVFRHVDPNIKEGDRVRAGDPIASVTNWTDGSDHTHVELWKTLEGGYRYENMIDPMSELSVFL